MCEQDHLDTLVRFGGAILPGQVNLEHMLMRKRLMGKGAPKVRVTVGKNYGLNSDGTPKPVRAIIEGLV